MRTTFITLYLLFGLKTELFPTGLNCLLASNLDDDRQSEYSAVRSHRYLAPQRDRSRFWCGQSPRSRHWAGSQHKDCSAHTNLVFSHSL